MFAVSVALLRRSTALRLPRGSTFSFTAQRNPRCIRTLYHVAPVWNRFPPSSFSSALYRKRAALCGYRLLCTTPTISTVEDAIKSLKEQIEGAESQEEKSQLLVKLVTSCAEGQRLDEAMEHCNAALSLQGITADIREEALLLRGGVLEAQGKKEEAQSEYRTAIAMNSGSTVPLRRLGSLLMDMGGEDALGEAEAVLSQALEILHTKSAAMAAAKAPLSKEDNNPTHINESSQGSAPSEGKESKKREAPTMTKEEADHKKELVWTQHTRGVARSKMKEWRLAIKDCEAVVALDDTYLPAYNTLADCCFMVRKWTDARMHYSRVVDDFVEYFSQHPHHLGPQLAGLDSDDVYTQIMLRLCMVRIHLGDLENAMLEADQVIERGKGDIGLAYHVRGKCWKGSKKWWKIIEDNTAALKLNGNLINALKDRAQAYRMLGYENEANQDEAYYHAKTSELMWKGQSAVQF